MAPSPAILGLLTTQEIEQLKRMAETVAKRVKENPPQTCNCPVCSERRAEEARQAKLMAAMRQRLDEMRRDVIQKNQGMGVGPAPKNEGTDASPATTGALGGLLDRIDRLESAVRELFERIGQR